MSHVTVYTFSKLHIFLPRLDLEYLVTSLHGKVFQVLQIWMRKIASLRQNKFLFSFLREVSSLRMAWGPDATSRAGKDPAIFLKERGRHARLPPAASGSSPSEIFIVLQFVVFSRKSGDVDLYATSLHDIAAITDL